VTVLDPLHRPAELHGNPGDHDLLGIEHHDLGAESAADERGNHVHLALGQAEHRGEAVANGNRCLRRVPDGELGLGRVPSSNHAAVFDGSSNPAVVVEATFDDQIRCRERRLIVALALHTVGGEVAVESLVDRRRIRREGPLEINHHRQRLHVHHDLGQGIFGDVPAARDDRDDRLAGVQDPVLGQRHVATFMEDNAFDRRRRHQQGAGPPQLAQIASHVGSDYTGHRQRSLYVHRADPRVSEVAAPERDVQHVWQLHVVNELGAAREQDLVLVAQHAAAEERSVAHLGASRSAATCRTASTMCW